jgi:hypothetical protein
MSLRQSSATLALTAAFGCTMNGGAETTDSAGDATTSVMPTTTAGDTAEPAPVWCNGFDPKQPATFAIANDEGVTVVDGTPLQVVCGNQGATMVPIYPHFGGFTPEGDTLDFDVLVDVEGFNIGAGNHFFSRLHYPHDVNCAPMEPFDDGYSYAFIPVFPPDGIPDIMDLDGVPGTLHVTLHSPVGEMKLDVNIVFAVDPESQCG